MKAAIEAGDIEAFYHLERAHHDKLAAMVRNKRLVRVLESLVDPLCNRAYWAYVRRSPEAAKVMYEEHLSILAAIQEGDGSKAEALMREAHSENACRYAADGGVRQSEHRFFQ